MNRSKGEPENYIGEAVPNDCWLIVPLEQAEQSVDLLCGVGEFRRGRVNESTLEMPFTHWLFLGVYVGEAVREAYR